MSNVFSGVCTIGRDAEVRYLPSGQAVLNVSVANNVGFGDKQQTVWLRVVLWGRRAEGTLKDYLKKGQQVFVSGELTMSEYTANDGTKKTNLELNATIIDLVGKRDSAGSSNDYAAPAPVQSYQQPPAPNYAPPPAPNYAPQQPRPAAAPKFDAPYDDDVPF
jgi:single-strand DNA-binding protein